jgi:3-oxoacyl-ACP reductase-like protein
MQMTKTVPLSLVGALSKTPYVGDFEFRKSLSISQILRVSVLADRLKGHSTTIDEEGSLIAQMVAELSQRVISAPEWWKNSNNGEDLQDLNVLFEVFSAARKVEQEYREEMEAKVKKAEESTK